MFKRIGSKKGAALILVVCVSAVIMALSMAIILAASSVLAVMDNVSAENQSKIWANTLTVKLQDELTKNTNFEYIEDENAARDNSQLWFYIKDNIITPTQSNGWRYYNEDEFGHNHNFSDRIFNVDISDFADIDSSVTGDLTVTMYWISESGANIKDGINLVIICSCKVGESVTRVKSTYTLNYDINTEDKEGNKLDEPYDKWTWTLSERE